MKKENLGALGRQERMWKDFNKLVGRNPERTEKVRNFVSLELARHYRSLDEFILAKLVTEGFPTPLKDAPLKRMFYYLWDLYRLGDDPQGWDLLNNKLAQVFEGVKP